MAQISVNRSPTQSLVLTELGVERLLAWGAGVMPLTVAMITARYRPGSRRFSAVRQPRTENTPRRL
jgi:hypothetical protein